VPEHDPGGEPADRPGLAEVPRASRSPISDRPVAATAGAGGPGRDGRLRDVLLQPRYLKHLPVERLKIGPLLRRRAGPGSRFGTGPRGERRERDGPRHRRAILAIAESAGCPWWPRESRPRSSVAPCSTWACRQGQGFLFARPMPARAATCLLAEADTVAGRSRLGRRRPDGGLAGSSRSGQGSRRETGRYRGRRPGRRGGRSSGHRVER
jgi:hypothetical protein